MPCQNETSNGGSDSLDLHLDSRPFDPSPTGWLLGQAVRYLNTADKEGEFAYSQVTDILRRCTDDLLETVTRVFRSMKSGDTPLRWNLLYVLGDVGNEKAAELLVRAALQALPESEEDLGCETGRDMEMLVSTMAVHALQKVARRHPEVSDYLLKIVSEKPARAILIEAVKGATELGLRDKVRDILTKEEYWMLEIRQARIQEVFADPEREDGKERGFTPPKSGALYTAPTSACCTRKEK